MDYIEHSAKGSTWTKKNHKYIRKEGNRYIYDDDQKKAVRERNFFKGRKLVRKNSFNGEIEQSGNAKARGPLFQFLTEGSLQNTTGSKADHEKWKKEANKSQEK